MVLQAFLNGSIEVKNTLWLLNLSRPGIWTISHQQLPIYASNYYTEKKPEFNLSWVLQKDDFNLIFNVKVFNKVSVISRNFFS